ncbi:hypothetical protein ACJIZ3_006524 [Penstemon smallii]|uniref:Uncharacterized protein n=1 Tax=Penstemon smallii TaxID=265156 RepID=A0ABD3S820_9LAMI
MFFIFVHPSLYLLTPSRLAETIITRSAFFKRLEGLQPCEVSELKAGTHIFAVYGWICLNILIF